jgi:hypothetical protein
VQILHAEAEWTVDQAANYQTEGFDVEVRDLKMIPDVEAHIWHHDPTNQCRNRGLAVERVRPVDNEAGFNRVLTSLFRIERPNELAHGPGRTAPAARHHPSTSRSWINVHAAGHLERLHEGT